MSVQTHRREGFPGQHLFVLPPGFLAQAKRHALLKSLYLTAAGYFPDAEGHLVERSDGVTEIILIACVSNRGWIQLENRKKLPVKMGEIVLIPSGVPHSYGADDAAPWSIMWVHFRGIDVPHFVRLLDISSNAPVIRIAAGALERLPFGELYQLLEAGCTLPALMSSSARLRSILVDLAQFRRPANERIGSTYDVVRANIEWMRANRHLRCDLRGLAAQAGLSVPHYSASFRRQIGASPMSYFRRLKIQYCAQLLALTELRIDEIASSVGIDDQFYFSRLFKKVMGQSPRSFRTTYKD